MVELRFNENTEIRGRATDCFGSELVYRFAHVWVGERLVKGHVQSVHDLAWGAGLDRESNPVRCGQARESLLCGRRNFFHCRRPFLAGCCKCAELAGMNKIDDRQG